jgi:cell division protein FtsW
VLARKSWWILGALWALLVVCLLMPKQLGAHRWIPMSEAGQLQPSEFTKLALILWTASFAERSGADLGTFKRGFVPGIGVVALTSALVIIEPDNGTALFLAAVGGAVLVVNGLKLRHLLPFVLAGVPAALVFMSNLHKYVDGRLKSFQGGFEDKIGQIQQALIAIGSGGLFGLGLGEGRAQLGHVSKIYNDFMLAAVGQQFGFVGTAAVVALFALLFLHGLRIAAHAPDRIGFGIAFGVSFMIALQAAINIAVATDTVPPKGINLPFLSYGGSSVLCLGAALGLLHSVARRSNMNPIPAGLAPAGGGGEDASAQNQTPEDASRARLSSVTPGTSRKPSKRDLLSPFPVAPGSVVPASYTSETNHES